MQDLTSSAATITITLNCPENSIESILKRANSLSEFSMDSIRKTLKNKDFNISAYTKNNKPINVKIDKSLYFFLKKEFRGYRVSTVLNLIFLLTQKKLRETDYGKLLFLKKDGWQRELKTLAGNIDGINYFSEIIVELKFLDGWKSALGQVLAYKTALGLSDSFSMQIWLLTKSNQINKKKFSNIKEFCKTFEVSVFFFNIDNNLLCINLAEAAETEV